MPRKIQILPDQLANQIAAGEVVERPASVVKELVENALDAGATRIAVSLRNGGKTEIRVADDGCGMGREDALLALDRHATSKIAASADLDAIRTLGFRGEALPSIASVSRFTLETAERDGDGTRVEVRAGAISNVEACARRRGTTVLVRGLFFNVPARAKFLRSTAAETRAVSEAVTVLSLAHPTVAISLESNARELLAVEAVPDVRRRIEDVWGTELAGQLIPVAFRAEAVAVTGLIQRPHSATSGGRRSYLFVNGRSFSDRHLVRAADRGFQTTIAPGARASLFLFLDLADGKVDVNVHPTKAEVRFREAIAVERAVEEAVRAALQPLDSTPSIGVRAPAAPSVTGSSELAESDTAATRHQMSLFVSGVTSPDSTSVTEVETDSAPTAMWQMHDTYIFVETRDGLMIVDQHSAHERVLYERLMNGLDERDTGSQRLLFPITLRLSPAEFGIVEDLSGILGRMGFEIEAFGGRSIIVHAVPNPHPYFDPERCLREMIDELTRGSPLVNSARNQHQRLALTFACKAAIKAGQKLSREEMSELFNRLFATELPYHDIHGRPTAIQLSLVELHNRFKRSG